jgi:IgA Peptidase M64
VSTADGKIIGTTQIVNNGPTANLFNIVILAEGFQQSELSQFAPAAQAFVDTLSVTLPYPILMDSINVFRVDVASTDSGADDPLTCPDSSAGSGVSPKTYFDATFCGGSIRRLLTVNNATAMSVAAAEVPAYDMILVIVNSAEFGGSGGPLATISRAPNVLDGVLHEMGHTAFNFADEYPYLAGCGSGETGHDHHPAPEPARPNVTTFPGRGALKWNNYVSESTPLPTTTNADCSDCDPQASPVPTGTVGAFEGADSFHCDVWRPEFDCRMRNLGQPFCHVCQGAIVSKLRRYSVLNFRLAWKGYGSDWNIYTGEGLDSDQTKQNAFGTGSSPALVHLNGLFMAWRGASNDQSIWYSILNTEDGITWNTQRQVPGVATSSGPALAAFEGRIYMAWKGMGADQSLWFANYYVGIWSAQAPIPNTGTSTQPALAVFNGRLYAAWKGIGGDQGIYYSSFDGSHWAPQQNVPNVGTSTYPTLAVWNGRLYMAWKGIYNDPSGWYSSFDGSHWAPQAAIPNVGTSTGFSLSASSNRLYLAWSGVSPDLALYMTTFDGKQWAPQRSYWGTSSNAVPTVLVYPD